MYWDIHKHLRMRMRTKNKSKRPDESSKLAGGVSSVWRTTAADEQQDQEKK